MDRIKQALIERVIFDSSNKHLSKLHLLLD